MKIIYKNPDGSIAIIHPVESVVKKYGIKAIAEKDVPEGLPFVIVGDDKIPTDRTFRDAWELPKETVFSGVGLPFSSFEAK